MAICGNSVTLGGKGSSLTSDAVYSIAHGLSTVQIDSSARSKLHQAKNHSLLSISFSNPSENAKFLTLVESRAVLAVLLYKLVVADAQIRLAWPDLIAETLNCGFSGGFFIPDSSSGSLSGLLEVILGLNGKSLKEIGVTEEEIQVVNSSSAVLIGISVLVDCSLPSLCPVADSAAALSCEALQADDQVFDLPISGEGFSFKDETDVAGDMRTLISGSKRVGSSRDGDSERNSAFISIPSIHGSLREVARSFHSKVRVKLNSRVTAKRNIDCSSGATNLAVLALQMAVWLQSLGESSLNRAKLCIRLVDDIDLQSRLFEIFSQSFPSSDVLRDMLQSVSSKISSEQNHSAMVHENYLLLLQVRVILAWEASLAMFLLEIHGKGLTGEVGAKSQVSESSNLSSNDRVNGGNVDVDCKGGSNESKAKGKTEKKKKKGALGKGTSVIKQLIEDRFRRLNETTADTVTLLVDRIRELSSFFDPKDLEHTTLLKTVKEIVESNEVRRLPKIPKGTRDFGKEQMTIRERTFSIIQGVFKRHGATALDTPVFELRETLMGKYGEDSKLIYDLADQGGEICSLRYDLTVPFARYIAMNNLSAYKRYQIAKVYRRDNPAKGRYREFYQCDFDIAGQYECMEADYEVIRVLTELLDELNIGDYEIKLNHRKLLDGMLEICGVSPEKFRTVCSSIDKLDKQPFEQIRKELVEDKGLSIEIADKIGSFVEKRGPPLELLSDLKQKGSQFLKNDRSVLALNDLDILFKALEKSKSIDRVVFDLSLARGLDYYTGVIFEAVFKGTTQVGSIAAGGRYDNLVGMFSGKQVPAVGVSLGIERVFTIMEQLEKDRNQVIRATETQVLVVALGKDLAQAAELVGEVWDAKLRAEFAVNKKLVKQIDRARQSGIPFMLILGESEVQKGVVILKDIQANKQEEIPRDRIVEELQRKCNVTSQSFSNHYAIV